MAGVLETLAVPRASVLPSAFLPLVAGSASSRRSVVLFSEFRGLKIQSTRSSASPSLTSKPAGRGGRVVCEAQDTAVLGTLFKWHREGVPEIEEPTFWLVTVPAVTDSTWKSLVLGSDLPVLVEFWAPWCGPCRIIHPVIDKLAKDYSGKLKCYKVNTDDSPSIATEYGIRSIPTVLIFKDGEKKDTVIGAVPESTLTTCIDRFV